MSININRANELVHIHACAFRDFDALVNALGGYRPSLDISVAGIAELADLYDAYQAERGDDRVAFRYGVAGSYSQERTEPLADRISSAKAKAKKEQRKGQRVPYQVATNLCIVATSAGELLEREYLDRLTKRQLKAFIVSMGEQPSGPWENQYFVEGEIEGADSPRQFMLRHDHEGWDDAGWINAREYWDVELSPSDL